MVEYFGSEDGGVRQWLVMLAAVMVASGENFASHGELNCCCGAHSVALEMTRKDCGLWQLLSSEHDLGS